jgi:hypothetical protein
MDSTQSLSNGVARELRGRQSRLMSKRRSASRGGAWEPSPADSPRPARSEAIGEFPLQRRPAGAESVEDPSRAGRRREILGLGPSCREKAQSERIRLPKAIG